WALAPCGQITPDRQLCLFLDDHHDGAVCAKPHVFSRWRDRPRVAANAREHKPESARELRGLAIQFRQKCEKRDGASTAVGRAAMTAEREFRRYLTLGRKRQLSWGKLP